MQIQLSLRFLLLFSDRKNCSEAIRHAMPFTHVHMFRMLAHVATTTCLLPLGAVHILRPLRLCQYLPDALFVPQSFEKYFLT